MIYLYLISALLKNIAGSCNPALAFCGTNGEFDPTFNAYLWEGSISLFHAGMMYIKVETRENYQDTTLNCGAAEKSNFLA